jgi:hypothetical protein
MELTGITKFLEKYKKQLLGDDERKETFCMIVNKISGIVLQTSDIEFKGHVVTIRTNPVVKNELFLFKEKILIAMKESGLFFTDIH